MKYFFILLFIFSTSVADAQSTLGRRIKDRAKEKAKEKINQKADNAVDSVIEKAENITKNNADGGTNNNNNNDAFYSSSKFDFKPGTVELYSDDFSSTTIGDFPENWFTNSSGEIVAINNINGHWFKLLNDGRYKPEITSEDGFPDSYTIEFDAVFKTAVMEGSSEGSAESVGSELTNSTQSLTIDFYAAENEQILSADAGDGGTGNGARFILQAPNLFSAMNWKEGAIGTNNSQTKDVFTNKDGKVFRVSIWIQNKRGRLYIDKTKVLDIPFFIPEGIQYNAISIKSLQPTAEDYNFFTNLRVAGISN